MRKGLGEEKSSRERKSKAQMCGGGLGEMIIALKESGDTKLDLDTGPNAKTE